MVTDHRTLFRVCNPPAATAAIGAPVKSVGHLPSGYIQFLRLTNGVECCAHDSGGDVLALWSAAEIPELNGAYEVTRWYPELLMIGSDGGDDAIGFDRDPPDRPDEWPVVRIGFGNLDRLDSVTLASNFAAWQVVEFRIRPRA
jgi:hypothetical protein